MKLLTDYAACIGALTNVRTPEQYHAPVTGVSCHSGKIQPGYIFVAIPGAAADGHDYVESAIARGAMAVVHSRELPRRRPEITYFRVADPYLAYALLCECRFDFPARRLRLHGITGTNGKTTSAYLLEHILRCNRMRCGLISTIEYRFGNARIPASRTTPEAYELHELFRQMHTDGCTDAVMEVSSHGLDQHRPGGARFHTALFTNLTGDHLDYHGNMENYYQAKKKLFLEYLAPDGYGIINIDDPAGKRLADECAGRQLFTFGKTPGCSAQIEHISTTPESSAFRLTINRQKFDVRACLIGEHNIYNLAGALVAAVAAGIPPDNAIDALQRHIAVPGRLELIRSPEGVNYFVDYAHTDDALKNVLTILRRLAGRKIIVVFGCGGNRDRLKRPRMGKVAAELSDAIVLTSDNPRNENPETIIAEIRAGVPPAFPLIVEPARRAAIALAARRAEPGDIVLIAGKGHETCQEQNGVCTEFDDRKIVRQLCNL